MDLEVYDKLCEEMRECVRCGLCTTRNQVVVGRGDPSSSLLFIGEAPGAVEDVEGVPFVGPAGRLFDELLERARVESFYIANVIKCRPPRNKFPGDDGSHFGVDVVDQCLPWLDAQIKLISPKVIVLVGKKAVEWTVYRNNRPAPPVGKLVNRWLRSTDYPSVEFFVIYHTSYVLRMRSQDFRRSREEEQKMVDTLRQANTAVGGEMPLTKPFVVGRSEDRPRGKQMKFF